MHSITYIGQAVVVVLTNAGRSLGADIGNWTDHTMMWFIAAPFDLSAVVGMVLAYCGVYGLRGIGV